MITGIDSEALKGVPLNRYSLAQRMSCAASRQTTRREDIAYCLLGIFDIDMPLLYGEGDRAFLRLQQAIMARSSSDYSLLAWSRYLGRLNNPNRNLLASSPAYFRHSGNLGRRSVVPPRPVSCVVLEEGVHIELRAQRQETKAVDQVEVFLNCADIQYPEKELGMLLVLGDDEITYQVAAIVLLAADEALQGVDLAFLIQQDNVMAEHTLNDMPKLSIAISLNHTEEMAVFGVLKGKVVGNEMILDVEDSWSCENGLIQIFLRGPGQGSWLIYIYPSPDPLDEGVPRIKITYEGSMKGKVPKLPLPFIPTPDAAAPGSSQITTIEDVFGDRIAEWEILSTLPLPSFDDWMFAPIEVEERADYNSRTVGPPEPRKLWVESRGVMVDGERKGLIIIKDVQPDEMSEVYHRLNPLPNLTRFDSRQSELSTSRLASLWKWFLHS